MLFRKEVKALARLVAKDLRAGRPSARSRRAIDFMADNPPAIVDAIDLIRREADRTQPDDALIRAYREMIGHGLLDLRFRIEGGDDWADMMAEGVREMLFNLAENGDIGAELLAMLLDGFIEARLPPGEDLTELMGELTAGAGEGEPAATPAEIGAILDSIAEDSGGDEFVIHANLKETGETLPPDFRNAMFTTLANAENSAMRDCATLFLLDSAPKVRHTACQAIAATVASSPVSPKALRRMIAIRNWLPTNERPLLDTAIKEVRRADVDCAPWPPSAVSELLATPEDGVGAQSVFAVAKDGKKQLFAALLVKYGIGILDAWCLRGQTKTEIKRPLGRIRAETESIPVSMDFVRLLVSHHLGGGLSRRQVPPVGLIDFIEAIGLETCQPAKLDGDGLIALLEPDLEPDRPTPDAINAMLERSSGWFDEFRFMESWFEADADVDAILSKRSAAKPSSRVKAITKSVLEPRRRKWAERFLWTAVWAREQSDLLSPWVPLFIVGRELHRGRPLVEIPVMRAIAEMTVAAAERWD